MATDTVPAAAGPEPPNTPPASGIPNLPGGPAQVLDGRLARALAPVEPARPTFNLTPTTGADSDTPGGLDEILNGLLDRSDPGVSSASFRGAAEGAGRDSDPAGKNRKRSVWKEMWLAAATRWAKGGGTANKRLDLAKARAQSQAHQVKENRTTAGVKSGGLPVRNTGGSGGGAKKDSGKSGGDSVRKGPVNSNGNGSAGSGRGGSGGPAGGRGSGGTGNKGTGSGGRTTKDTGASGKGSGGSAGANGGGSAGKDKHATEKKKADTNGPAPKGTGKQDGASGGSGKPGSAGKNGKDGPSGTGGKTSDGKDAKGPHTKTDLTKDPKKTNGKDSAGGPKPGDSKNGNPHKPGTEKTPLEKSRETGHGDGTKARRVVDHVKAYVDGTRDGWSDEKQDNAKEHARLDKAHTDHKATKPGTTPGAAIVTDKGDDGMSTDVKPLMVKNIDANTITLGTAGARGTVSRRELRNFKQYEYKLEEKETVLQKISEACKTLEKQAEQEAKECQDLAEQAKGVKGGEKLVVKLNKLAEAAKNQAVEAAELARRAKRAAEMCKVVLTNIQTRYAPLYKAVVDSDETKPAELRFYNDKGSYAAAA